MMQPALSTDANEPGGLPPGFVAGMLRVTSPNGEAKDVPFTARIESARLTTDETPEVS